MLRHIFRAFHYAIKVFVFTVQLHRALNSSPTGKALEMRAFHGIIKFSNWLVFVFAYAFSYLRQLFARSGTIRE